MWAARDVLHKNNSACVFVLGLGTELINKKFGAFRRNLGCYFNLSEMKFVLLHHGLELIFKIRLDLKNARFSTKPDDSSLFIGKNLIDVDKIL